MRLARPPKWAYWLAADSNTHKEHFAIEWGCECPEMMLNGRHFYLHSDRRHLLFLQNGKMLDLALASITEHSGHASRRLDNLRFIDDFEMDRSFPHLTSTIKSKAHQIAQPRIPPPKKSTQSGSSSQGERSYTPVKRSQVQTINPDISPVKYAADVTTGGTTWEITISESAHSQALSTQNLDVKSRDVADLNNSSENVASQKRPTPVQKRRQKRTRPEASPNSTVVELHPKAPRTSSRVKTQVQPMNINSSSSKSYNYAKNAAPSGMKPLRMYSTSGDVPVNTIFQNPTTTTCTFQDNCPLFPKSSGQIWPCVIISRNSKTYPSSYAVPANDYFFKASPHFEHKIVNEQIGRIGRNQRDVGTLTTPVAESVASSDEEKRDNIWLGGHYR
ncbi:Oidioi.mRNA.OKI2018_I69.PAR.g11215.t1.cds [Oikopleura dioica]|uniref:Oidioi.mRNA.OKI2018_I69.PAR.g11215.t1.cds n=1 Tax=Oikopleura dioica TaxID=34765 RepID=A0ABN7RVH6_OIKDI|nr:Oidioi.mRNA.OKI2018_I69.PAR.g11215.t1.cds [Oikopleura dioica]